jgi:plastocyanin
MTTMKYLSINVPVLLLIAVAALAVVPRMAGDALSAGDAESAVRVINLVARDMTFYVDGQAAPNPALHARPGERIRVVLKNTDAGMSHDFAIRSWGVTTKLLKGKGEDSVEFTVPSARGAYDYSCTPHAEMMSGTLIVN